ncbi:hypothetical protein BPTFM16_01957 [Altererythrobacter insulae]|nr:hypothetical protein BPTFM16_01957 [Altererythrobacter insulae]
MAFWLASERYGQQSDFIQRFEPRFWTVDFPRPAMASVIRTAPDSMQVDCEFHHEGELVGLIWDSEDKLDHPLLAYETSRNYQRTTLSFRWQSSGLIALDQTHGPTLTIEGRDQNENPKSWFVRLWNYADGSPTDAIITLPFSSLEGGWMLPGDPVNALDIDRMFISLVPPGYVAGGTSRLPQRVNGRATISSIHCDGENAMLEIGDVIMPVHGERMCTAYDDAYNQTPDRLIRNLFALGYREEVVHYVGMSHFMRLGGSDLKVAQPAELCTPAKEWHRSYFAANTATGLDTIISLSFELFEAYCPDDWKQRAFDGTPAQTGWVPPSTLLSPTNVEAMGWLQKTAADFTALQLDTGQQAKFQIGEPWWWVTADGKPCLYDAASSASFSVSAPVITDMRAPLIDSQQALLDEAGALLAQATANLSQAVRAVGGPETEVRLLIFTPTILDPVMPELRRANLPIGWAYPAFDRLQLEDYDWLTSGRVADRKAAYEAIDQAFGYPTELQDYLSGFVLLPEDADRLWPFIDQGLDEARARGVERRFVWALPQVTRDGFTRLPTVLEEELQPFDDILYPFPLGRSTAVGPEFSTSVVTTSSGHERRNSLWSDARLHFDVGPGIRSEAELSQLIAFFRARRGPARGFRISDPFDFSSNEMTGSVTPYDQTLPKGDGQTTVFALRKSYGELDPQIREITRPQQGTVRVSVNDNEVFDWSLDNHGKIVFDAAPPAGAFIAAGFLFDVPVRFAEDRIDVSAFNFAAGEAPSIPLIEVRETK